MNKNILSLLTRVLQLFIIFHFKIFGFITIAKVSTLSIFRFFCKSFIGGHFHLKHFLIKNEWKHFYESVCMFNTDKIDKCCMLNFYFYFTERSIIGV